MKLELKDHLELIELAARYGNVFDDRDWDRLATLFTDDAAFIVHGHSVGELRLEGLAEIRKFMSVPNVGHPVAHHVTNVEIRDDLDPPILVFKVIAPEPSGMVHSTFYRDRIVKTPDGWRIVEHVAIRRRTDVP